MFGQYFSNFLCFDELRSLGHSGLKETLYRQTIKVDKFFYLIIALNHVGFRAKSAEGGQVLSGPHACNPT
jgi:hypothetical protein